MLAVAGSTMLLLLVLLVLRRMISRLVLQPLNRVETHMEHGPRVGIARRCWMPTVASRRDRLARPQLQRDAAVS